MQVWSKVMPPVAYLWRSLTNIFPSSRICILMASQCKSNKIIKADQRLIEPCTWISMESSCASASMFSERLMSSSAIIQTLLNLWHSNATQTVPPRRFHTFRAAAVNRIAHWAITFTVRRWFSSLSTRKLTAPGNADWQTPNLCRFAIGSTAHCKLAP